ncbi:DUF2147 domain-containing protein [Labrys neptuniae]|uniref:DUF2147 domain-containing protein n=1 Tax=Labrys neptuniae TaxID=376174 RepID=UPI00288F1216|nr:DUF2147 domain-containing protein [Labrys neptuniae]MDT3381183.1 DUF2147 domain-containing protein [Labrys neptuniae]
MAPCRARSRRSSSPRTKPDPYEVRGRLEERAGRRPGDPVRPEEGRRRIHGGQILDPDNGKVYSSKIYLTAAGRKLNVRGYIGVSMLGRSQVWQRQE